MDNSEQRKRKADNTMSTPLGDDSEVIEIPAGQGSDPNAGWGEDGAVVDVPNPQPNGS